MPNLDQMQESIESLGKLALTHHSLPPGIIASCLNVSKSRVTDLIRDKKVLTVSVIGARWLIVSSALTYAKARLRRIRQKSQSLKS